MPRASKPQNRRLTLKQQAFVDALPTAHSYTEAARIAGYADNGNSALRTQSSANMAKPDITAALSAQTRSLAERTGWTQERILKEWAADSVLARKLQQPGVSVRAVELIAKATGALRDQALALGQPTQVINIQVLALLETSPEAQRALAVLARLLVPPGAAKPPEPDGTSISANPPT